MRHRRPATAHDSRAIDPNDLDAVSGGWSIPLRWLTPNANATLDSVDNGAMSPDPSSRLGAYAATANYPEGTVGYAVHNSIGDIYRTLGTAGEEHIGDVFNSPDARALYNESVHSDASLKMAQTEYSYWQDVRAENPYSLGGNLGSAVPPAARDYIQQNIEGGQAAPAHDASIDPSALPHDANLPDTTPQDVYGMDSALGESHTEAAHAPEPATVPADASHDVPTYETTPDASHDTPTYDTPTYETTPDASHDTPTYEPAPAASEPVQPTSYEHAPAADDTTYASNESYTSGDQYAGDYGSSDSYGGDYGGGDYGGGDSGGGSEFA
jgi:hypothetical protein